MSDYAYRLVTQFDEHRRIYKVTRGHVTLGEVESHRMKLEGWAHHQIMWRARRTYEPFPEHYVYSTRKAAAASLDSEILTGPLALPEDPLDGLPPGPRA